MGVIIARLVQYVRDVFLATSFTFFFNLTQAAFGRRDHLVNRPSMAVYHLFVRLVAYSSLMSCSTHRILRCWRCAFAGFVRIRPWLTQFIHAIVKSERPLGLGSNF